MKAVGSIFGLWGAITAAPAGRATAPTLRRARRSSAPDSSAGAGPNIARLQVDTHGGRLARRDDQRPLVVLKPGGADHEVANAGRQVELIAPHRLAVNRYARPSRHAL